MMSDTATRGRLVSIRQVSACSLGLRRTPRHNDLGLGPLLLRLADRLPRLPSRLGGHRAGIENDRILKSRLLRMPAHDFGLEGIEPASKRNDIRRVHESSPGGSVPSKS
jgi:hypothetical protein